MSVGIHPKTLQTHGKNWFLFGAAIEDFVWNRVQQPQTVGIRWASTLEGIISGINMIIRHSTWSGDVGPVVFDHLPTLWLIWWCFGVVPSALVGVFWWIPTVQCLATRVQALITGVSWPEWFSGAEMVRPMVRTDCPASYSEQPPKNHFGHTRN